MTRVLPLDSANTLIESPCAVRGGDGLGHLHAGAGLAAHDREQFVSMQLTPGCCPAPGRHRSVTGERANGADGGDVGAVGAAGDLVVDGRITEGVQRRRATVGSHFRNGAGPAAQRAEVVAAGQVADVLGDVDPMYARAMLLLRSSRRTCRHRPWRTRTLRLIVPNTRANDRGRSAGPCHVGRVRRLQPVTRMAKPLVALRRQAASAIDVDACRGWLNTKRRAGAWGMYR